MAALQIRFKADLAKLTTQVDNKVQERRNAMDAFMIDAKESTPHCNPRPKLVTQMPR